MLNESKPISEMSAKEIMEQLSFAQKEELLTELRVPYIIEDVLSENETVPEEIAEDIARKYLSGEYDCNLSYWSNIQNLIDDAYRDVREVYFADLISEGDIDLIDKLDNMRGSEISEAVYEKCKDAEIFKQVENRVMELMKDKSESFSSPDYYEGLAKEYETEDIRDKMAAEIYNCDLLYMTAIADVLDLERPKDATYILGLKNAKKQIERD